MKDPCDKIAGYSGKHLIFKSPFDHGLHPVAKEARHFFEQSNGVHALLYCSTVFR